MHNTNSTIASTHTESRSEPAAVPMNQQQENTGSEMLSHPLLIQYKLTVGAPDDPLEKEADAMADQVMRMPDTTAFTATVSSAGIQRKCSACEEEEKLQRKELSVLNEYESTDTAAISHTVIRRKCAACEEEESVRRKPSFASVTSLIQTSRKVGGNAVASEATTARINATRGTGSRLDNQTRSFMESRFNADFSGVSIHTGDYAVQMSRDLNAQAFTVGSDIYFNSSRYNPSSDSGKHLLAHELTHTIQQGGAAVKRRSEEDEQLNVLSLTTRAGNTIQRQEMPELTREEEIALSGSSEGEFEVTNSPFAISIFNFAINSATLKQRHIEILTEVARLLRMMPSGQFRVVIDGNTDDTGAPSVNDPLSLRRANAVRRFLRAHGAGGSLVTHGEGEDLPVVSNESLTGRNRNRRVDITLVPIGSVVLPVPVPEPVEDDDDIPPIRDQDDDIPDPVQDRDPDPRRTPEPRRDPPPGQDDTGICQMFPLLCAAGILVPIILCIITGICIPKPPIVPPPVLPPPPGGGNPPQQPPAPHACIGSVSLPGGNIPIPSFPGLRYLSAGFDMRITFISDPVTGCDCNCGEYRQYVRGFFERDRQGNGTWNRQRKALHPGIYLDEFMFQEDGTGAADSGYGHRSHPNLPEDHFIGCEYSGNDNPGMMIIPPNEGARMRLEFLGVPVDVCAVPGIGLPFAQYLSYWKVEGEFLPVAPGTGTGGGHTPPTGGTPGTPSTPGTPGGGGTGAPTGGSGPVQTTPRPTAARPTSPHPARYAGGIPQGARIGEGHTLRLSFTSNGHSYVVNVPVHVTDVGVDTITVTTDNTDFLNVAPPGDPEVILAPGRVIPIPRQIL